MVSLALAKGLNLSLSVLIGQNGDDNNDVVVLC